MVSPSTFCGVGERDRFRRMGEQAGVLRLELLAVLPCSFLVYSLEKFGVTDGVVSGTLEDAHQHPQVFSGREPEHPYTHSQLLPALLPPNGDFSFLN